MRRLILGLLLLSALAAANVHAETLRLSRADLVVKITNPARQLQAFSPLLDMLEGMLSCEKPSKNASMITSLHTGWTQLANIPGAEAGGDFWLVLMPKPVSATAAPHPRSAAGGNGIFPGHFPLYRLVPLADPAAFTQYMHEGHLSGTVCGHYGIITDLPSDPLYRDIDFDVVLHTKRALAIALLNGGDAISLADKLLQSLDIIPLGDNPLRNVDVRQVDVGLSMAADDLSLEYYLVPSTGGVLEKSLRHAGDNGMAREYAGYLPPNLAYCSASGAMLNGAPGVSSIVFGLADAFLATILPATVSGNFSHSMKALMAQCSKGRALALTSAPPERDHGPTLVAIYHITSAREAQAAVHKFIAQVQVVRKTVLEGVLAPLFTVELHPAAETVAGTPVDVVNITLIFHPTPHEKNGALAAAQALHYTCRVAYLKDKMLLTVGEDSKAQMIALFDRIDQHTAGFTASAPYQALQAALPAQTYSFTSFASYDLASALVKLVALDKEKDAGMKLLSVLPAQHSVVLSYQAVQAGVLRGELRLPAEQLNFCYTLLKALTMQLTNSPGEATP